VQLLGDWNSASNNQLDLHANRAYQCLNTYLWAERSWTWLAMLYAFALVGSRINWEYM